MLETVKFDIECLTPMFTGGVDRYCDRLHETGIIGSMRWWYELIIRGLGFYACDPTSKDYQCKFDPNSKKPFDEQLCPVCRMFGTTGWRRQFNLQIKWEPNDKSYFWLKSIDRNNQWWLNKIFEFPKKGNVVDNKFAIVIRNTNNEIIQQLKYLLSIMQTCGGIGAKNQYGFGIFECNDSVSPDDSLKGIYDYLRNGKCVRHSNEKDSGWNNLEKLWWYDLAINDNNSMVKQWQNSRYYINRSKDQSAKFLLPTAFDIRYKIPPVNSPDDPILGLRASCKNRHGRNITRKYFGYVDGDHRQRSNIFVSHLYRRAEMTDYHVKAWGFSGSSHGIEVGEELKRIFEIKTPIIMNSFSLNRSEGYKVIRSEVNE
ncbi:MAG: type III-B CRISPR module RAMP protein Cmr1 [Syntrophomonadaceae bacterium]|nr:type III-B CRISPR module RAMP protein Cmr1 [Syntrophomonadaceae bacterium]